MSLNKLFKHQIADINTIAQFLAVRDLDDLSCGDLIKHFGIMQADMLILLGSSILHTVEQAAKAFNTGIAKELMIVGGIGHSTEILRENVNSHSQYAKLPVSEKPEAEIFKEIMVNYWEVPEEKIMIENRSTNCGDNAIRALEVLHNNKRMPESIILIQDPTMQLRTHASFLHSWSNIKNTIFINYPSFVPRLVEIDGEAVFEISGTIHTPWTLERFLSLLMGEIPRLLDNEAGYGPLGRGYIAHVDIPEHVMLAYERLVPLFKDFQANRNINK